MKFKISNKTYYSRHSNEIKRFIEGEKSLHIINKNSKNKINDDYSDKIFIDFNNLSKQLDIKTKYDVIVLSDVVEMHPDIFLFLKYLSEKLNVNGKLIVSTFNYKYKTVIYLLEILKLKDKSLRYSYMRNKNLKNITIGLGYDYINTFTKQILPFNLFGIGNILNKILESLLYFFGLGIKNYSIFRLQKNINSNYTKALIIPAKNEAGNLEILLNRIPPGEDYQVIIPCGISEDNTIQIAKDLVGQFSNLNIVTFVQSGRGKANAVWEALEKVEAEAVAILDADISVDPETIPSFFEILENNKADFVNGTRLIYPMENGAMQYFNHLGNRVFQFIISKVINYQLTDSLCGTKVFKTKHYSKIKNWQKLLKTQDPFGDFDLIFSAAFTGQKIVEYPIHYKSRIYGKTQISRFRDGLKLINYLVKSYFALNTSRK